MKLSLVFAAAIAGLPFRQLASASETGKVKGRIDGNYCIWDTLTVDNVDDMPKVWEKSDGSLSQINP